MISTYFGDKITRNQRTNYSRVYKLIAGAILYSAVFVLSLMVVATILINHVTAVKNAQVAFKPVHFNYK